MSRLLLALASTALVCGCKREPKVISTQTSTNADGSRSVTVVVECHGEYWASCEYPAIKAIGDECPSMPGHQVREDKIGDPEHPSRIELGWVCGHGTRH